MPVEQGFVFETQSICAALWEPPCVIDKKFWGDADAVRLFIKTISVTAAAHLSRAVALQEVAGDSSKQQTTALVVFQFFDAAFTAAIAERFPLGRIELIERKFPDGNS